MQNIYMKKKEWYFVCKKREDLTPNIMQMELQ